LAWVIFWIRGYAQWNITLCSSVSALMCQRPGKNAQIIILLRESGPHNVLQESNGVTNVREMLIFRSATIRFIIKLIDDRNRTAMKSQHWGVNVNEETLGLSTPQPARSAGKCKYPEARRHIGECDWIRIVDSDWARFADWQVKWMSRICLK
jgi:hypothetical protein